MTHTADSLDYLLVAQVTDIHLTNDPQQLVMGVNTEASYGKIETEVRRLTACASADSDNACQN